LVTAAVLEVLAQREIRTVLAAIAFRRGSHVVAI